VSDILQVGQMVKVQINKIDRVNEKISLSMKNIAAKPWESASEKYPEGLIVKGKVASISPYGAFVELEPGVEGLLHVSEYAWNDSENKFKKEVKTGQTLEVKILNVDKENQKMSLSVKKIGNNPWEEAFRKYAPGSKVKGVVKNISPFGAFVTLDGGVEGLIHISDLSWTKRIKNVSEVLKSAQEVEAIVLDVNPAKEKISLSIKHLQEDPYKKYKAGANVSGKVTRAEEFGVFVELENGIEGFVAKREMFNLKEDGESKEIKAGDTVDAQIIKVSPKDHKIDLSIKKYLKSQEKELIKQYAQSETMPSLGDLLQSSDEE
jgi:small subunit ribosomal protein S1